MRVGEAQATLRQPLDVRRGNRPGTVRRDVAVAEVVRIDEDNVGRRLGEGCPREEEEGEGDNR